MIETQKAMWWWLSFVDTSLPKPPPEEIGPGEGGRFLGVCIVEGSGMVEAVTQAWNLDCNPGGEVAGFGPFDPDEAGFSPEIRNRLLTRDELAQRGMIGSWDDYGLEADEDGYLHEKDTDE